MRQINWDLVADSRPTFELERQIQAKTSEFMFERVDSGDEFLMLGDGKGNLSTVRWVLEPKEHIIQRLGFSTRRMIADI